MTNIATDLLVEKETGGETPGAAVTGAHMTLRDGFRQLFRRSWIFRIGLIIVTVDLLLTLVGPLITPYPTGTATPNSLEPPSGSHWFGTDASGFDIFSRVLAAPRIDLTIALSATALAVIGGSAAGLMVSFYRNRITELALRLVDTFQAFPPLVLVLVVIVMLGPGEAHIVLVLGVLGMPLYIRLMRAEVLALRELPFVEAAVANGGSRLLIAFKHVLPNAFTPGLAQTSVSIGSAVLATAGLSFIGAGIRPPAAEWGGMISSGSPYIITGQWWLTVFPGIAMALTVFGFAAAAEGLQTVLGRRS